MPVSADQFKDVLRLWASGVSVVTVRREGGIRGITVSSFCSLSLEPPLVLICIARSAESHGAIRAQRCFGVNILRADQVALADLAAGRSGERGQWLEGAASHAAVSGAPLLDDSLGWLDCALTDELPGGDHTIFVGCVEAAGGADGAPLLWYRSSYRALGEPPPAVRRPPRGRPGSGRGRGPGRSSGRGAPKRRR